MVNHNVTPIFPALIQDSSKGIQKGSSIQTSVHVIFWCGRSHFDHAPCDSSSCPSLLLSQVLNICLDVSHFSFFVSGLPYLIVKSARCPALAYPCKGFQWCPSISCFLPVSVRRQLLLHPNLAETPTPLTSVLLENIFKVPNFVTLNSSTTDDRCSCNWPDHTLSLKVELPAFSLSTVPYWLLVVSSKLMCNKNRH